MPEDARPREDRLIIGLDFGTTFTGVSFCYSNTPEDIEVIRTWPGGNNITSEKVPTEFSYGQDFKWGFQIKPEQSRIRCIKLFLDRNKTIPAFAFKDDTLKALEASGKSVIDAVSDYLTMIFNHTMTTLTQRFSESLIKNTKIQFIVTVPAVWTDAAKHATLTAAKKAGIADNLRMISEPEAAACYTLKAIQPNHLNVGNNIVVCDAGGGTVDLITYRITQLEPLALEESGVGTGGLCGAAFVNFRFEDFVRNKLGEVQFAKMIEKKPKTWQTGLKYFEEYVKRNCNMDEDEEFNVPFPGLPDNDKAGVDSGFMIVTSEEVRELFDPIVKQVIELIQGQVTSVQDAGGTISAILLVGGFGQSVYLLDRVREYFKNGNPPPYSAASITAPVANMSIRGSSTSSRGREPEGPIKVMQPPNAWTAVVRGAVLRGLEGTIVTERRSRYHYGMEFCPVFSASLHPESSKYWDEYDDTFRCYDAMRWYVRKNERISEQRVIRFPFYQAYDGMDFPKNRELTTVLRISDANPAPVMYDSESMLRVCTLTVNIHSVPRDRWQQRVTTSKKHYWRLSYVIEMRIDSAQLEFAFKVGGVEYGSVNSTFDD